MSAIINAKLLWEIIEGATLSCEQYEEMGNSIRAVFHESPNEYYTRILYKIYKITDNHKYICDLLCHNVTHIVNDPIMPVNIDRVKEAVLKRDYEEARFLFTYLSDKDKTLVIDNTTINYVTYNRILCELFLPYCSDPAYCRLLYTIAYRELSDMNVSTASPAEYLIARKYTNWDGSVSPEMTDGLYGVLSMMKLKDMPLLQELRILIASLDKKSRSRSLVKVRIQELRMC